MNHIKGFLEIYKITKYYRLSKSSLLDNNCECENMIRGTVVSMKLSLSHSLKAPKVNHLREIPLQYNGIQLGQGVINHGGVIIALIIGIISLNDWVNDVGSPRRKETRANTIIEELHEDGGRVWMICLRNLY